MIRSMTGYGAAVLDAAGLRASASVRSVNHRFLDVQVQVSRPLRPLEPELRRLVQARLARGRVEVSVQASMGAASGEWVVSSPGLVEELVRVLRDLEASHGLDGGVRVTDVARVPGVVQVLEAPAAERPPWAPEVLGLVSRAIDQLEEMRRAEGGHLERALRECLDAIAQIAAHGRQASEDGKRARSEALLASLSELKEAGLDEARLHQEAVRLVERSDVTEEIDRLLAHVEQARGFLDGDAPCGRRLDFLAQELGREANTLAAKAASTELVRDALELKNLVERLREQVQNVE